MKKISVLFLILLITGLIFSITGFSAFALADEISYNTELVTNGNFENGLEGWTETKGAGASYNTGKVKTINPQSDLYNERNGLKVLEIEILSSTLTEPSFFKYTTSVYLIQGYTYKLSADINITQKITSSNDEFLGAYVSFENDSVFSRIEKIQSTKGAFVNEYVYISPKSTGNYNLNIGIGSKTMPASGIVQFDNISLVAIEKAPAGTTIFDIGPGTQAKDNQTIEGKIYISILAILSVAFCILSYYLIRKFSGLQDSDIENRIFKKDNGVKKFFTSPVFILSSAIIFGFAIRLIICNFISGYTKEISVLSNYASSLVSTKNPALFYEKFKSSTAQSGTLYLLWIIGYVSKWLNVTYGSIGFYILLKIPAIISDLIMIYIVYEIASRYFNKICSTVFAVLYAIIPVFFTLSSAWGSFIPLMSLFLVLSLLSFIDKKPVKSMIFYTIALMINTSAIYLLPVLIGGFIIQAIYNGKIRLPFAITTVSAFVFLFLISLPFTFNFVKSGKVFYFLTKIIESVDNYSYYTVNNLNFFALLSKNVVTAGKSSQIFNIILMALIYILLIYMYYRNNNRLEILLYSSFALIFYSTFGLYTHPYYAVCGLVLMFVYMLLSSDRRIYLLFTLLSFTTFINLAQVMNISGYFGSGALAKYTVLPNGSAFSIIFSILNILLTLYYSFILYKIGIDNELDEIQPYADKLTVLFNKRVLNIKSFINSKKKIKKAKRIK